MFPVTRCEVLVVGGGPSGLAAALGARRAGADVILMERFGCFGGVITTVGMETLAWYRYLNQQLSIIIRLIGLCCVHVVNL
jgi:flavin-dependent dehydrogenase